MKAISLWQPWATAMAIGSKLVETRHWPTNIRGPVVIHAAQRMVRYEFEKLFECGYWQGAILPAFPSAGGIWRKDYVRFLPLGALVAVGELYDCRRTEDVRDLPTWNEPRNPPGMVGGALSWTECDMGNYEDGRFAWCFRNIRMLKPAITFKGKQGFFEVPDDILKEAA